MTESPGVIRPARPDEAAVLTELTWRAVAFWGYDEPFLAAAREVIRVRPEHLAEGMGFVLEEAAGLAGFSILAGAPPELDLQHLMVEPRLIGTGRGKRLWRHAVATAAARGASALAITSDPNAEPFYRAMGAVGTFGEPSPHKPEWQLRQLRFTLPASGA